MDQRLSIFKRKWCLFCTLLCGIVFNVILFSSTGSLGVTWYSSFQTISFIGNIYCNQTLSPTHNVSATQLNQMELWLETRKNLLSSNVTTKVFLFAHMRGGSSIAGELFNTDPHAVMWYEPGDAFFAYYYGLHHENIPQNDLFYQNLTRRSLNNQELKAMTDYYTNMLNCNLAGLPPEAMGHYFLRESTAMDGFMSCMQIKRSRVTINKCSNHISIICSQREVLKSMANKCHTAINVTRTVVAQNPSASQETLTVLVRDLVTNLSDTVKENMLLFVKHELCLRTMREDNAKCLDFALKKCKAANLNVLQVNRMKMENLEPLIIKHPDIRVIHYLRDPRAIALSRSKTQNLVMQREASQPVTEAKFLCQRMAEDLKQRKMLEQKYPGAFLQIKYEDFVQEPIKVAGEIYSFIGENYPRGWTQYSEQTMHSKVKGKNGQFGITVTNATETSMKWKKEISKSALEEIQTFCGEYLSDANYLA